jgi:hypothetical protein
VIVENWSKMKNKKTILIVLLNICNCNHIKNQNCSLVGNVQNLVIFNVILIFRTEITVNNAGLWSVEKLL